MFAQIYGGNIGVHIKGPVDQLSSKLSLLIWAIRIKLGQGILVILLCKRRSLWCSRWCFITVQLWSLDSSWHIISNNSSPEKQIKFITKKETGHNLLRVQSHTRWKCSDPSMTFKDLWAWCCVNFRPTIIRASSVLESLESTATLHFLTGLILSLTVESSPKSSKQSSAPLVSDLTRKIIVTYFGRCIHSAAFSPFSERGHF